MGTQESDYRAGPRLLVHVLGARARRAALLLVLVPPLLVALLAFPQAVKVPFFDEWVFASDVVAMQRGTLEAGDLWRPHNEHRLLLPRIVLLALAWLTDWDPRAGIGASWLSLLLALGLLLDVTRRSYGAFAPAAPRWLGIGIAALLFTLGTWDIWSWGWTLQIVMLVLGVVVAAWILARWRGRWSDVLLLVVVGCAAALSFGSGLLLLPVAALVLALAGEGTSARRRMAQVAVLAASGAAMAWLYRRGLPAFAVDALPGTFSSMPLACATFTVAFVGAPLAAGSVAAAVTWGIAGCVALLGLGAPLVRAGPDWRCRARPWLFLGAFVLAMALLTAGGRARLGTAQALNSHYQLAASLLWISLLGLGGLTWARRESAARIPLGARAAVTAVVLLAVAGWLANWKHGSELLHRRSQRLARASWELRAGPPWTETQLRSFFPDVARVGQRALELRELGLGPFARRGGVRAAPPSPPPGPLRPLALEGLLRADSERPGRSTVHLPVALVRRVEGPAHARHELQVELYEDGHVFVVRSSPRGRRSASAGVEPALVSAIGSLLEEAATLELPAPTGADEYVTTVTLLEPRTGGEARTFAFGGRCGPCMSIGRALAQLLAETGLLNSLPEER